MAHAVDRSEMMRSLRSFECAMFELLDRVTCRVMWEYAILGAQHACSQPHGSVLAQAKIMFFGRISGPGEFLKILIIFQKSVHQELSNGVC